MVHSVSERHELLGFFSRDIFISNRSRTTYPRPPNSYSVPKEHPIEAEAHLDLKAVATVWWLVLLPWKLAVFSSWSRNLRTVRPSFFLKESAYQLLILFVDHSSLLWRPSALFQLSGCLRLSQNWKNKAKYAFLHHPFCPFCKILQLVYSIWFLVGRNVKGLCFFHLNLDIWINGSSFSKLIGVQILVGTNSFLECWCWLYFSCELVKPLKNP